MPNPLIEHDPVWTPRMPAAKHDPTQVIKFDSVYPTVAGPPAPLRFTEKLPPGCDPHWYTVIICLFDISSQAEVLYAWAWNQTDAGVKAAAHVLGQKEKRLISWLEAYDYLRTQTHQIMVIDAQVSIDEYPYAPPELDQKLHDDYQEEQKRANQKT